MTDLAACEHPDTRIVWSDWLDAEWLLERVRVASEVCAACEGILAREQLWESEIVTRPADGGT